MSSCCSIVFTLVLLSFLSFFPLRYTEAKCPILLLVLHALPRAKHCPDSCLRPQLPRGLFDSSSGLLRSCFLCCRRVAFVPLLKTLTLSPSLTSFICDAVLSDARHISLVFSSVSRDPLSSRSRTLP